MKYGFILRKLGWQVCDKKGFGLLEAFISVGIFSIFIISISWIGDTVNIGNERNRLNWTAQQIIYSHVETLSNQSLIEWDKKITQGTETINANPDINCSYQRNEIALPNTALKSHQLQIVCTANGRVKKTLSYTLEK